MKKLSNILLRISGFYYLLISIGLMLSTIFSLLVDKNYIFAIFDLLGFSNISINLIKPIFFILLLCLFILISLLTKRIFSSINDKRHFLSNMFAGFFFLFASIVGHVFLRDNIFIISYIFNIFLIIGSMLGLREKSEDYYENLSEDYEKDATNNDLDKKPLDNEIGEKDSKDLDDKELITLEDVKNKESLSEDKKEDEKKDKPTSKDKKDDKTLTLEDVKREKEEGKESED